MNLQQFNYQSQKISVLQRDGQILFDATPVCNVLGYARKAANIVEMLDDDEKILLSREDFEVTESVTSVGQDFDPTLSVGSPGARHKWFVTEPGLYHLILRSNKPEAKPFRRWVTHEVLPAIRRTGSYSTPPPPPHPMTAATMGKIERMFNRTKKLARGTGLSQQQSIKIAAKMVYDTHGIDIFKLLEIDDTLVNPNNPLVNTTVNQPANHLTQFIKEFFIDTFEIDEDEFLSSGLSRQSYLRKYSVATQEFRQLYYEWCRANKVRHKLSSVHLGRRMSKLNYKKRRVVVNSKKRRIPVYYGLIRKGRASSSLV